MPINNYYINRSQKGFSLIEIMIAVFVLSIGFLGLAKLQAAALQTNQSALLRSQVTLLASDMFDNMRANQVAAEAGDYEIALSASPPTAASGEVADQDLALWFANLITHLPGDSDASIVCDDIDTTDGDNCTRGSMHTIVIQWREFEYDNATTETKKVLQDNNFTYSGVL